MHKEQLSLSRDQRCSQTPARNNVNKYT